MTPDPAAEAAYRADDRLRSGEFGGSWHRHDVYVWGWQARDAEVDALQAQLAAVRRDYESALTSIGLLVEAQGRDNVARSESPAQVMYECITIAACMAEVTKTGRLAVGGNMGGHVALKTALAVLDQHLPGGVSCHPAS